MRLRMLVARYGDVPPARGPARDRYLRENGEHSLAAAKRDLGIARRTAISLAERVGIVLPPFSPPIDTRLQLPAVRHAVTGRRQEWTRVRSDVVERTGTADLVGDATARSALRHAVDALN